MSDYIDPAFQELQTVIKTAWPFVTGGQYRDTQIKRIKWVEFLQAAESGDSKNFDCPFVVEEFGPWVNQNDAAGWGYAGDVVAAACSVFLIDKSDFEPTTVTALSAPGTGIVVESTEGWFAGQNIVFDNSVIHKIATVDGPTTATMVDVTGITAMMSASPYDKAEELAHHAKTLRDALDPRQTFQQFFTTEFAVIDNSSSNPANMALAKANYRVQAVQLSFTVLIGQT